MGTSEQHPYFVVVGVSSTMKQKGFHLGMCDKSFALNGVDHSTKFPHFCRLMMIQATSIPMPFASKTINVNK
jgi:hypothetical protein